MVGEPDAFLHAAGLISSSEVSGTGMVINPVMPATGLAKGALVKVRQHAGAEHKVQNETLLSIMATCTVQQMSYVFEPSSVPSNSAFLLLVDDHQLQTYYKVRGFPAHENSSRKSETNHLFRAPISNSATTEIGPMWITVSLWPLALLKLVTCAVCIFSRAPVQRTSSSVPRATRPRRYACSCRRMGSRALSNIRYPT
jgi:hypothetical protein